MGVTARTHTVIASPVGPLTLVAEGAGLVGVFMELHRRRPPAIGEPADTGFDDIREQLDAYFAGELTEFDLPLAPRGDDFQLSVWNLLRQIPYGETRSYGDLARELGDLTLARAVGGANAANPLSIVVPCHRVIGSDGKLVGYAGGLERKRFLLDLERPADAPVQQSLLD
ncbi:MAG: methylated-DNA-[protein]-cysteine S-methyltransferase [Thermoleophilaceae bacterium]|nr:methylated-DNA-[protein]-cysteine S-methyltransferase [Thermoleophilaceae bacterium]